MQFNSPKDIHPIVMKVLDVSGRGRDVGVIGTPRETLCTSTHYTRFGTVNGTQEDGKDVFQQKNRDVGSGG